MQPRIMIVDDDLLMCEILKDRLEALGYSVIVVNDGHSALALLALETKPAPIPLVLLDVNMPGLDGFSVLRRMRASHPEIAVLMMSAALDEEYPELARHWEPGIGCRNLSISPWWRAYAGTSPAPMLPHEERARTWRITVPSVECLT